MAKISDAGTTPRKHRATYARDKRNGGYLIRVAGPYAELFSGHTVPVTMKDGSEHEELLENLVWVGTTSPESKVGIPGEKVALYHFAAKPREQVEPEF
jgi:lantibiotic modifying enzyme